MDANAVFRYAKGAAVLAVNLGVTFIGKFSTGLKANYSNYMEQLDVVLAEYGEKDTTTPASSIRAIQQVVKPAMEIVASLTVATLAMGYGWYCSFTYTTCIPSFFYLRATVNKIIGAAFIALGFLTADWLIMYGALYGLKVRLFNLETPNKETPISWDEVKRQIEFTLDGRGAFVLRNGMLLGADSLDKVVPYLEKRKAAVHAKQGLDQITFIKPNCVPLFNKLFVGE